MNVLICKEIAIKTKITKNDSYLTLSNQKSKKPNGFVVAAHGSWLWLLYQVKNQVKTPSELLNLFCQNSKIEYKSELNIRKKFPNNLSL